MAKKAGDKVIKQLNSTIYELVKLKEALEQPGNQSWFKAKLGEPDWVPKMLETLGGATQVLRVLREVVSDGQHAKELRPVFRDSAQWESLLAKPEILEILKSPIGVLGLAGFSKAVYGKPPTLAEQAFAARLTDLSAPGPERPAPLPKNLDNQSGLDDLG